eukprot:1693023-Rhodomonas_salina.4
MMTSRDTALGQRRAGVIRMSGFLAATISTRSTADCSAYPVPVLGSQLPAKGTEPGMGPQTRLTSYHY